MATLRKPPTKKGGRPKGVPNKRTLEIQERLEAMGCDPLTGLAEIAQQLKTTKTAAGLKLRAWCLAELAQYVAPKRKAVEHSGALDLTMPEAIEPGPAPAS